MEPERVDPLAADSARIFSLQRSSARTLSIAARFDSRTAQTMLTSRCAAATPGTKGLALTCARARNVFQRLFKELFYRKGFQYDNMFDWTVLNLVSLPCSHVLCSL